VKGDSVRIFLVQLGRLMAKSMGEEAEEVLKCLEVLGEFAEGDNQRRALMLIIQLLSQQRSGEARKALDKWRQRFERCGRHLC